MRGWNAGILVASLDLGVKAGLVPLSSLPAKGEEPPKQPGPAKPKG